MQAVSFGSFGWRRDVEDARTFKDQFRQICARHHVDLDERYVGNDARIDGITGRPVGPTNKLSLSVTQGCTLGWDTDQPFGLMAIDPDQPF